MARAFDDGSSQYLTRSSNLGITTYPFTFAIWFNSDSSTPSNQALISIGDTADVAGLHVLRIRDPADSDVIALSYYDNDTNDYAKTTTQWSVGTWHCAVGVFTSATSRAVYLDGGGKGTNATSIVIGTLEDVGIGYQAAITPHLPYYMSGNLAEGAVWDVSLTDAEVAVLATGVSPLAVRPQSLVAYWPLIGNLSPELDFVGGYDMTLQNAPTKSEHPPIYKIPPLHMLDYPEPVGQTLAVLHPREGVPV